MMQAAGKLGLLVSSSQSASQSVTFCQAIQKVIIISCIFLVSLGKFSRFSLCIYIFDIHTYIYVMHCMPGLHNNINKYRYLDLVRWIR